MFWNPWTEKAKAMSDFNDDDGIGVAGRRNDVDGVTLGHKKG